MLPIAILFSSTLLEEVSETIGKKAARLRRENLYSLAFLGMFWTVVILIVATFLGAKFKIGAKSLPTLILRIPVEILLTYASAEAVIHADRSTLSFIRLTTIPLLLVSDIALGYHLSALQVTAVITLFVGLLTAFHKNSHAKKGSGWAAMVAVLAAVSATLYKWDISHYNSVAAEQIVVYGIVVVTFYIWSSVKSGSPLPLLIKPLTGTQSMANGIGLAIESFAYTLAPASVVAAIKRSFAVMWSVLFGHKYFHERKLKQKVVAGLFLCAGLIVLTIN